MKSPKDCKDKTPSKGFSLLEILVTTAIFAALAGLGLFVSMDVYRGVSFRSERDVVVSLLQRARSRALANINQSPHGLCYDDVSRSYVIFRGATYVAGASTNELLPTNNKVSFSGFPLCSSGTGVVFTQLSATTTGANIAVIQNARTESVTVNSEGLIVW